MSRTSVECEMSSLATIKAMLHATKYPSKSVLGLLVGKRVVRRKNEKTFG